MKKYLLLSGVALAISLAGCSKTEVPNDQASSGQEVQNTINNTEKTASQEDLLSGNDTTMCPQAIKDYLSKADFTGKGDKVVKKGDQITVHYVGRLNDKEVFDTSVESVAKACGKYTAGRNYNEGLAFGVGAGQMIAWFDKGVEGMKVGQTKTLTIPAKEAYGEWSDKNLIVLDRKQLPEGDVQKGTKLQSAMGQTFTVYKVEGEKVTLDANHELAGKDLIFDITIVSIK